METDGRHAHQAVADERGGAWTELRLTGLDAAVAAADWRLALTAPDGTLLPIVTGAGTPA
ncbi:hypothetical protein [Streptomyces sp. NPDC023838]|uniref:hypothetical protein n=1 Tax=Streptomyces sp. NPDC023838 TaxID=3154325 RepID=UPI0033CF94C8